MSDTNFVYCEKCNKKLIERKPGGLWRFCFGKTPGVAAPPVDMYIYGTIKLKCIRKSCGHWNVLNRFVEA